MSSTSPTRKCFPGMPYSSYTSVLQLCHTRAHSGNEIQRDSLAQGTCESVLTVWQEAEGQVRRLCQVSSNYIAFAVETSSFLLPQTRIRVPQTQIRCTSKTMIHCHSLRQMILSKTRCPRGKDAFMRYVRGPLREELMLQGATYVPFGCLVPVRIMAYFLNSNIFEPFCHFCFTFVSLLFHFVPKCLMHL